MNEFNPSYQEEFPRVHIVLGCFLFDIDFFLVVLTACLHNTKNINNGFLKGLIWKYFFNPRN